MQPTVTQSTTEELDPCMGHAARGPGRDENFVKQNGTGWA